MASDGKWNHNAKEVAFFKRHLVEQDETYVQHARMAGYFAVQCLLIGICSLIHAVFPFLFTEPQAIVFSSSQSG